MGLSSRSPLFSAIVYFCIFVIYCTCVHSTAISLPAYNVNINQTTVSGLSSGGFMAVQMHIAYSSNIIGAGVFAGGPYNCAKGSLDYAERVCMHAKPAPNPSTYVQTTSSRFSQGEIDDPANLANDRVFLFSGTEDTTVHQPVMNSLQQYYLNYITADGAVEYVNTIAAAHTQPTNYQVNTNPCDISESPYLSYCSYDGAGDALNQIFNNSLNALNSGVLSGTVIEFDQTEFYSDPNSIGLAANGYAYIPASCASNTSCLLHVTFHGCLQDYASVGYDYINNAGYNEWADSNNIIVLYPQTVSTFDKPENPNACWDWWGYNNNPNTYDTKSGIQMQVIYAMMQRISSGYVDLPAPQNLQEMNVTDTSIAFKWLAVSGAVGYYVYRDGDLITTSPDYATSYNDIGLDSGTTYQYNVAAVTSDNAPGALSSSLSVTTTGTPPPLSAPTNLTASSISSTTITLIWNSVKGASNYGVYRDSDLVGTVSLTTYTDVSLTPSTTYTYDVDAINSDDTSSFSAPISVTTTTGFECTSYTDNNYDQVQKGRAYEKLGITYANGSNQDMGLYNIFVYTELSETAPNYYVIGTCNNN